MELSLVCSYGLDLIAVAAGARAAGYAEIVAILGPDPDLGPADIAVHISDVVVGNPNLV